MAAAVAAAVRRREEGRKGDDDALDDPSLSRSSRPAAEGPDIPPQGTGIWKYQRKCALFYVDLKVQISVAGLISGNFLANVVEKWVDPDGTKVADVWYAFDLFFNIAFLIELILNMYGFWFYRFWMSAWNVFDFVVVTIGMLDVMKVPLPGPLSMLRMMRAFRVFRLFKRVKSLNKIMVSLAKAVPGVINAFVILTLVMCIYAILGVEFFSDFADDGTFTTDDGQKVKGYSTARGLSYGDEYFGNFGKALYTCFQVLTCESWSEAIARPLLNTVSPAKAILVTVYFVSYNLIIGVVLINVVIAVLLEKMVDDDHKGRHPDALEPSPEEEEVEMEDEDQAAEEQHEAKAVDYDGQRRLVRKAAASDTVGPAMLDAMEADFSTLRRHMCSIREQMELLTAKLTMEDDKVLE
eukprot:TRINITY_DN104810_c0_g1_i1.p1 TRINITY_DN104810_c0_g1~~TRINITY_DN104810_c0_g1_i1.p1  ORF type:complete len:409 (+),score=94.36 TRINITY_DN104810_c0_g1_i1:28-1254(+)